LDRRRAIEYSVENSAHAPVYAATFLRFFFARGVIYVLGRCGQPYIVAQFDAPLLVRGFSGGACFHRLAEMAKVTGEDFQDLLAGDHAHK
jgi:hypothetical protein